MQCSKLAPISAPFFEILAVSASGQTHREHRALARLARHRHVATHHARELAGYGKAQSGSAEVLGGRGIGLGEFFEQLCLLLGGTSVRRNGEKWLNRIGAAAGEGLR